MTSKQKIFVVCTALAVFVLSIVVRAFFLGDLAGSICYEMEAANRMLHGQVPFRDFYFDEPLTLVFLRMPAVLLAQLLSGHSSAAVLPFNAMAIASFLEVSLLATFSFAFCIYTVVTARLDHRRQMQLWFALIGFAIANFAMGYSYGCAQHIFCLLLSPYFFLRLTAWFSPVDNSGKTGSHWPGFFAGILAGFAASLDPLFIIVPITVEAAEFLSRRLLGKANSVADEFFWLLISFLVSWSYLLQLDQAALKELFDWIIPLKITSYYLDQIAYFGLGATPDRRDVIYVCTAAAIVSFGIVNRLPLLRPIMALMMAGFVLYQMGMSGLSSDILVLIWAICLCFSVQFLYLLESSFFSNIARRYPKLSYRRLPKVQSVSLAVVCSLTILTLISLEIMQRRENVTVLTGPKAIDPTYLELADAFPKYCQAGDSIMILNGRLLPGFPLYSLAEKPIASYFISTEAFSSLANIEAHNLADHMVGKPFGWIAATKKMMFDRLRSDIDKNRPGVIVVEGGQTFDGLEKAGIIGRILAQYKCQGEARYHSRCVGAKEFADWNYRYNVYDRHSKEQK